MDIMDGGEMFDFHAYMKPLDFSIKSGLLNPKQTPKYSI